jgi:hypothetical protein
LDFCYEPTTPKGVPITSIDCEIDCELHPTGGTVINAVYVGKENLFDGDTFHRALACLIAGEAEDSPFIRKALRDAADKPLREEVRRLLQRREYA